MANVRWLDHWNVGRSQFSRGRRTKVLPEDSLTIRGASPRDAFSCSVPSGDVVQKLNEERSQR